MFRKFMSLVVFAAALLCAPGCELIEEAIRFYIENKLN